MGFLFLFLPFSFLGDEGRRREWKSLDRFIFIVQDALASDNYGESSFSFHFLFPGSHRMDIPLFASPLDAIWRTIE